MKKVTTAFLLATLFTFMVNASAWGQLLNENFNYPDGDSLNVLHGWVVQPTASYVNTIKVATPGLTYTGYPSSGIGNSALVDTTGQDIYHSFTGQTSGSVYAAFLVSPIKVTTAGDYFLHFSEANTTTFRGRVYSKLSGSDVAFGLLKGSAGTPAYTTTTYPLNTTHLVVLKYTFNTGSTTDDSVYLWVNPAIGGAEPSPDLSYGSTDVDFTTLSALNLRQGTAANAPRTLVDGIRVGTSWDNVVNGVQPPLSGTKTIGGASPDYLTIKSAIRDLNAMGVTAPGVTFVIRDGSYSEDSLSIRTSTANASAPITFKPDAGATVVINVAPPNTTYNFAIKLDSTKYVTIDGSNNGTTSRDLTINAVGANGYRGIWVSGASDYATIKNCIVTAARDIATPTTSIRGIDFLYTGAAQDPDFILCENNLVRYAYYGIRLEGNLTNDVMESPVVRNNVIDSVAAAGIYAHYHNFGRFYGNDINIKRGLSGTIYGIYVGSVANQTRIFQNRIHDINQLSTTTGITYGIYSSGTSTLSAHSVYNNFIWAINAQDAATGAIYGIYDGAGNTTLADTIAFNTVSLTGTTTGNKITAAFYKGSATGPAFVRDNVFQNTRTDGTTGVAVAIYKISTATVLNSNYNNLYVGAPDANHQIGRIASTNYATIADWRTANTSDAVSVTEGSPFVSATDLHMQTTVPTQLESGGTPVDGITADIDNEARNVTTPDIGADEFVGIAGDATAPSIVYTPLGNTNQTTSRSLTAAITDPSGVPTSGIGLPVLYWRVNSGVYTASTGAFVSGNDYSFAFGSGAALGDTISYFVAAQDNAAPPNVGVSPSLGASGFTANPPAASTPPTSPSRYFIAMPPLAGGDYTVGLAIFEKVSGKKLTSQTLTRKVMREIPVGQEIDQKVAATSAISSITPYSRMELREVEESYTVLMENNRPYDGSMITLTPDQKREHGLSADMVGVFPTITSAVFNLNLRGLSGPVRFLLTDATYPSETFPITINITTPNDSFPTATNTVTIKPSSGVTTTIAGASASGQILKVLNGHVIIDGSNVTGGTSRNLTIQNTSATAPQVLVFGSTGTTPIVGDTLKNCIIINGANTSTAVIVSDGTAPGTAGYFSNIGIVNNQIRNAYMGIYSIAAVLASNGSGTSILNNEIGSTATDSIRYVGVYMQGLDGGIVRGNNIGAFSIVTGEIDRGVWLATGTTNALVQKNTIHDLGYVGGSGYGAKGIVVSTGLASCNDTISNNMIYHLFGDGDSYSSYGATYSPVGIYAFGTGQAGVNIFFNTIFLSGNTLNYAATVYAIGIALDDGTAASVTNNLIVNTLGLLATTGVGPVGIAAEVSNAQFTAIDYNDYYSNAAAPAVNNVGKIAATDYPTLVEWAPASGGDTHSISANVGFVSSSDLHVNTSSSAPVDSAATPIAGITDDFDGNTRNATFPDMGADEFTRIILPSPVVSAIARSTRVPVQNDSVTVTCTITDSLGITTANLLYASDGVAQTPVAMTRVGGTPTNGTYAGVLPGTANQNGRRIEYQIQANSSSGQTTTTAVTANNSYFAGLSPMSLTGVKAVGPNRILLYDNYYARVTGTVNGPNYQTTSISYFFQDAVGGMDLFKSGTLTPALALGDSIIVLGRLDQFAGLTEITPDTVAVDIAIVASGRPVTPIPLTMTAFNNNPELYESRLIKLSFIQRRDVTPPWPNLGGSANIVIYQSVVTDTVVMRIDSDTEIDGSPEPTYPVTIVGIAGQFSTAGVFNNGYQIQPRYLTDFTAPATPGWTAQNSGITNQFYSVKAVSPFAVWAAALGGRVLRTVDGGATWANVGGGRIGTADIYNITAVDGNTAFVTTTPSASTYIFRTTNGGAQWDTVYTLAGGFIDAIHMYDATNGIAMGDPVGGKYVILRTTNGGATWARIATEPTPGTGEASNQNDLCVFGPNNIWFGASANGRIYRSTDAGATWLSSTIPGAVAASNVIAVWFNSAQYGIASSVNGTTYTAYRSTDGGATWTTITVGTAGYNIAVSGSGSDDFWMARGTDVYRSTNRGASWTQSYTGTGTFYDVDFITSGSSTYGWGVKDNGNIVSYFGTITGVEENGGTEIPQTYSLLQNYPNPFNPTTTLRYAIPKASHVTMKIYNMLGQEVATLRDEIQSVGFHEAVWNGRNTTGALIASGVYFYRIEARPIDGSDSFSSIKKMIMLK